MRVLFCHDAPLQKDKDGNYYGLTFNNDTLKRYYDIGEHLTILLRERPFDQQSNYTKINLDKLDIVTVPGFKNIIKISKIVEKEVLESDCVVVRLPSMLGLIASRIAKKNNIPILVELVGDVWNALNNHSIKGKLIAPLMYLLTKKTVKNSNYVVYVTKFFLQSRYPTKGQSESISNVQLQTLGPEILEKRIKKIKELKNKEKLIIGTIGALDVSYKGQDEIIKMLAHLKKINNTQHIEYQLVGGGNSTQFKKLAKKLNILENVKFLGTMPSNKIYEWLRQIDIYIQPSKTEGLPRSVIEAMSQATPVIGSDAGGIPELIDEKFLFDHKNSNSEKLYSLLKQMDEKEMLEQAKKNYVKSFEYSYEKLRQKREKSFKEFRNCYVNK
ncbi:glycosyltransferase [Aerococcus viridans]